MISDWRGERRIGPAPVSGRAWSWVWRPLALLALCIVGATLVLPVQLALGNVPSVRAGVHLWAIFCAAWALILLIIGASRGWWLQPLVGFVLSIGLALLVFHFALPVFATLDWFGQSFVPPVTP